MTRKEKIKLLNDIKAGRKTVSELLAPIIRIWVQDVSDPKLFHCENEKLTSRMDERLSSKKRGQTIINVWEHSANCPPIAENESQVFE